VACGHQKSACKKLEAHSITTHELFSDQIVASGILSLLNTYYLYRAKGLKAFNICPHVDFESMGSAEGFGCGYRNLQMMISYLIRFPNLKRSLLKNSGTVPSILSIQESIEAAWKCNFDKISANQFQFSLKGSTKWIGTSEIVTFFSYYRLRTAIYQFHSELNPLFPGKGQKKYKANTHLVQFAFDYYMNNKSNSKRSDTNARDTTMSHQFTTKQSDHFISPMYLQYNGHSCTIVGAEQRKNGDIFLIMFDPSKSGEHVLSNAKKGNFTMIHFPASYFTKKEYQVVLIQNTDLLDDLQWESSKTLKIEKKFV